MAYQFSGGSAPKRQYNIEQFQGVDFASPPLNIDPSRSPDALNMVSDVNGYPVCRPGYETVLRGLGSVNGIYTLEINGVEHRLIHHGVKLSRWQDDGALTVLSSQCSNRKSTAAVMFGKLYFFDGNKALIYGEFPVLDEQEQDTGEKVVALRTLEEEAYIPVTSISGGTAYEAVNLVTPRRKNQFLAKAAARSMTVQLDQHPIQATGVKVRELTDAGDWLLLAASRYTVNATTGKVSIEDTSATPVTGMDNYQVEFIPTYRGWQQVSKSFWRNNYVTSGNQGGNFPRGVFQKDFQGEYDTYLYTFRLNYIEAESVSTVEIKYLEDEFFSGVKLLLANVAENTWESYGHRISNAEYEQYHWILFYRWYREGSDLVVELTDPVWTRKGSSYDMNDPYTGIRRLMFSYQKRTEADLDCINHCTVVQKYGVSGNADRLFLTGNTGQKNYDWWSDIFPDKANYFPDLNYARIGSEDTAIMGYGWLGDGSLAIHKEWNGQDSSLYIRTAGLLEDGTAVFPVRQGAIGLGVISSRAFGYLDNEPLALSSNCVFAVTPVQNIAVDERYAQDRSYFINPKLKNEGNLSQAEAIVYQGNYYLAINDRVYVAVGGQKQDAKTHSYEWYLWDKLPVRIWWEQEERLYFGTADGRLCRLTPERHFDDGKPVACYWLTPPLNFGHNLYYKKIKNVSAISPPYAHSQIRLEYLQPKGAKTVKEAGIVNNEFEAFPVNTVSNYKAKKVMTIQLKLSGNPGEPFGFYGLAILYTVSGKYKG